ncbi:hypothetical protein DPX16_14135 [Anabarilius grahami]|uniref:Uncharacterized protein n=1 Tax=Anabarilius grahami TaxID=495550 RepID=A0A3N0Z4B3_ANAGA|nr:hypothetical protein DPX16_14135 [Anabarilius grahami]
MGLCDVIKVGIPCMGTSPGGAHVHTSTRVREQEHAHQRAFGFTEVIGSAAQVTRLHEINNVTISAYGFINKAKFYAGFADCLKLKDGAVTAVMIPVMSQNHRCALNAHSAPEPDETKQQAEEYRDESYAGYARSRIRIKT